MVLSGHYSSVQDWNVHVRYVDFINSGFDVHKKVHSVYKWIFIVSWVPEIFATNFLVSVCQCRMDVMLHIFT